MTFQISPVAISLIIASIGAGTGIASLVWHISNSRSKIILERVHFTLAHRHTHKEVIDITGNIRNKSNRATTIENIYLHFGNRWIPLSFGSPIKIDPNSSYPINLHQNFTPEEFKDILKDGKVKIGIDIEHTFGIIKKYGYTDFSSDWLTVT